MRKEIGVNPSTPSWNGIKTGNQDFPRLFFDYAATLFRVLDTMLEHSMLIQSWVSLGVSYVILCDSCRRIWQYIEIL